MKEGNKILWDLEKAKFTEFNGGHVVCNIVLPEICLPIIDSPIFQRLRKIKQLGPAEYVFPGATHTRFVHSLGTANLAQRMMANLKKKDPNLNGTDVLCVIVAALCHDLGHGPFSHLFEEVFEKDGNDDDGKPPFRHETMTLKLLKLIFLEQKVRDAFEPYFSNDHVALIGDLINPPLPINFYDKNKKWQLKIKDVNKAYIYAIVSNPINGLDVDKLEYLLRDAYYCGISLSFGESIINRYLRCGEIEKIGGETYTWLSFPVKLRDDIRNVYQSRINLHSTVCCHHVHVIISEMIKNGLKMVQDHYTIYGTDNDEVTLRNCIYDPIAYQKLDDTIFSRILYSNNKNLKPAREMFERIESRRLPRIICKLDKLKNKSDAECRELKERILLLLNKATFKFDSNKIEVICKNIHAGKGHQNPLVSVSFFSRNFDSDHFTLNSDKLQFETIIFIYAPYECKDEDAKIIYEIISKFAKSKAIANPPINMFRATSKRSYSLIN